MQIARCTNCGRRNRVPAAARGVPRCGNCHRPLPWIADAGALPEPGLRAWLEQALGEA